jgi:hypothetical protein
MRSLKRRSTVTAGMGAMGKRSRPAEFLETCWDFRRASSGCAWIYIPFGLCNRTQKVGNHQGRVARNVRGIFVGLDPSEHIEPSLLDSGVGG